MARPRTPKGRARLTVERLAAEYPGSAKDLCELDFTTPFELLVATVLSAQTTDVRVNEVTPALFAHYPTPAALAAADPAELEQEIRTTGFFRSKAKSLIGLGQGLDQRFGGEVPGPIEDLVTLPGVGRKTANVVRSVAMGLPGFPVDTHVTRLTKLLGLTEQTEAEKIEAEVTRLVPRADWGPLSLRLILHGRRVCIARRPRCGDCPLADFCPSAQLPVAGALRRRQPAGADSTARPGRRQPAGADSTAGPGRREPVPADSTARPGRRQPAAAEGTRRPDSPSPAGVDDPPRAARQAGVSARD